MINKKGLLSAGIIAALLFSIFWNYQQRQDLEKYESSITEKNKKNSELKKEVKSLNESYNSMIEQNESEKETLREVMTNQNNKSDNSELLKEFDSRAKSLFQNLYTFSPDNFKTVKNRVSDYLTVELLQENFKNVNNSNTGDSYGTSSEMLKASIYSKSVQSNLVEGLAVITFEVTPADGETVKTSDIYEISYDPLSKKFTKYDFLGKGKTGDSLE